MTKFNAISGFTGSEIERASMASCAFPMETPLERAIKQRVANGLVHLANAIAPSSAIRFNARNFKESYC